MTKRIESTRQLHNLADGTLIFFFRNDQKVVGRIKRIQNGKNLGVQYSRGNHMQWHQVCVSHLTEYFLATEAEFVLYELENA